MKTSSKNQMSDSLEILDTIKKVKAPDALYDTLMESINNQSKIAWWRVSAVAAVLVCLITLEVYIATNTTTMVDTAQMEQVVSIPDNSLYYE